MEKSSPRRKNYDLIDLNMGFDPIVPEVPFSLQKPNFNKSQKHSDSDIQGNKILPKKIGSGSETESDPHKKSKPRKTKKVKKILHPFKRKNAEQGLGRTSPEKPEISEILESVNSKKISTSSSDFDETNMQKPIPEPVHEKVNLNPSISNQLSEKVIIPKESPNVQQDNQKARNEKRTKRASSNHIVLERNYYINSSIVDNFFDAYKADVKAVFKQTDVDVSILETLSSNFQKVTEKTVESHQMLMQETENLGNNLDNLIISVKSTTNSIDNINGKAKMLQNDLQTFRSEIKNCENEQYTQNNILEKILLFFLSKLMIIFVLIKHVLIFPFRATKKPKEKQMENANTPNERIHTTNASNNAD
ncbi:hypothetical protein GPJ56_004764 [Histomonas meleagridis]|uniref:uncharacterized protein n=1 Tax=Histomonas meleagridis TaxID=135588 RepID=UPI00355A5C76|nr:hypothetical protein GPJ56_004764 [Histomonas meleagridis]KAH0801662.1 hypothetical protein GO595_005497 [Histomonas meleagridis]